MKRVKGPPQQPQDPLSFLSVVLLQDVVRPSQTTGGGAPRGVRLEVNRLSEKIRGWMGGMKIIKNEEEK